MGNHLQSRLKLHHLRVLSALESSGSLVNAAVVLGLTQPALTKTLREIETIAGNRLFERHARGVSPNNAGKRAAEEARRILGDLASLERRLEQWGGVVEDLTIGALPSASAGILPPALSELTRSRPHLRVQVREGSTATLISALANGELDVVIGRIDAQFNPEQFDRIALYDDVIVGVARADHPALAQLIADPASSTALVAAVPLMVNAAEHEIMKLLAMAGIEVKPTLYATSLTLLVEFVLGGEAIAFAPRLMVAGELSRGTLVSFVELWQTDGRRGGAILRQEPDVSPIVRDFIRAIVATLPNHAEVLAEARRWLQSSAS